MRLFQVLAVIALLPVPCVGAGGGQRPSNVLFIAIDDLRTELGCYGVPYARSPHLDRLASEGALFLNHFAMVPTCGSSRFAMLTGRCPSRSGVKTGNRALYAGSSALARTATPGAQSLPELFRRSGYRTVCIGKISHTPDGKVFEYNGKGSGRPELPGAWDDLATPYGPWKRGWGVFFAYTGGRHREDGQGHRDVMEFAAERDEDLPDGLMAKRAIAKLEELKRGGRPFFLGLGFYKPHLPFVATKADWDAMAKVDVPPPPHPERVDSPYWHRSGEFYRYRLPFPATNPLAPADQVKVRRAYLACVRFTDRQVGKVLDALDRMELSDSTIVVVWGDHGWHLGDTAMWGKHSPFERALHSTLIVRAPGVTRAGLRIDAPVESIDIFPTLVDLCRPSFTRTRFPLDGRSLVPLLAGRKTAVREAAVSYWKSAVSVRTATHRLIATMGKGSPSRIELYDVGRSPDPVENIAADHPELVKKLLGLVPAAQRRP